MAQRLAVHLPASRLDEHLGALADGPVLRQFLHAHIHDELARLAISLAPNPFALSEIVTNLVTNALDAVDGGGQVVIETSDGGSGVEFRVTDAGPGIAPAIRERLFQPFQSTKPMGKGTGLGLAISKRLVDAHSGTIEVESREGAGTTVSVRLPLAGGNGA